MRRVPTLMTRELKTYFQSPLAYVLAALYSMLILLLIGMRGLEVGPKRLLPGLVVYSSYLLIVLVPILTMRLLAEEKDSGTMEVLVTDPVTDWDIVLGKFLAGVAALWAILLPMAAYVAIYAVIGRATTPAAGKVSWYRVLTWVPMVMEWGPVFTGFLGLALFGALLVSVGLFASSLTRNQAISALAGFALILMLCVLFLIEKVVNQPKLSEWIASLSLFSRMQLLLQGRLDSRAIFLFLSTTVLMLFLTVRVVESRKWR